MQKKTTSIGKRSGLAEEDPDASISYSESGLTASTQIPGGKMQSREGSMSQSGANNTASTPTGGGRSNQTSPHDEPSASISYSESDLTASTQLPSSQAQQKAGSNGQNGANKTGGSGGRRSSHTSSNHDDPNASISYSETTVTASGTVSSVKRPSRNAPSPDPSAPPASTTLGDSYASDFEKDKDKEQDEAAEEGNGDGGNSGGQDGESEHYTEAAGEGEEEEVDGGEGEEDEEEEQEEEQEGEEEEEVESHHSSSLAQRSKSQLSQHSQGSQHSSPRQPEPSLGRRTPSQANSTHSASLRPSSAKRTSRAASSASYNDSFVQEDDGEDDADLVPPPTSSRPSAGSHRPESAVPSSRQTPPSSAAMRQQQPAMRSYDESFESDTPSAPPPRPTSARPNSSSQRPPSSGGAHRRTSGAAPTTPPPVKEEEETRSQRSYLSDSWEGDVRPLNRRRPGSSVASSTASREDAGRSRSRPASAAPRDRQGAIVEDLMRRHPVTWDVRDVCTWVDVIGMGQYRRKFAHNCIDGRLLLTLDDTQLKAELGIPPLGHRRAILDAIETLASGGRGGDRGSQRDEDQAPTQRQRASSARRSGSRPSSSRPAPQEYPRRPASASPAVIPPDAYLGPALGKITVYEQRAKLLFELDRAAARAAQHKTLSEQLNHMANLSEDEVAKLRGMLQDLERKNKIAVQYSTGALDSKARIPWRPNGPQWGGPVINPNPEKFARPGDDPNVDMTFKPKISNTSRKILAESYGQTESGQVTFLDRLANDARKRERSKQEIDRKYYSMEAIFQDPMRAKKLYQRDLQYLNEYLLAKGLVEGVGLAEKEAEYESQINEIVESYADEWKLKEAQVKSISSAKGPRKVTALAAAIRTMLFMQRYEAELKQKGERLKTLQKQSWEQIMGRPQDKEAEDIAQALEFFSLLGWRGDDEESVLSDARLAALVKRARKYKTEVEGWRDRNPDKKGPGFVAPDPQVLIKWNEPPWSTDGLWPLMEAEMQRAAGPEGGVPSGTVVTTPHAPSGDVSITNMTYGSPSDYLTYTIKLLGRMRWDDLDRLDALTDRAKRLGVYRGVRTQKFLEFTEAKIVEKEKAIQEVYDSLTKPKRVITKTQQDGFFERLLDDATKRKAKVDKLMTEKQAKEAEILKSSAMYKTRPRTAR